MFNLKQFLQKTTLLQTAVHYARMVCILHDLATLDCFFIGVSFIESRRPLPISTIQFGDPRIPSVDTFIPRSGLDLLYGVPSIHIEQSLEIFNSKYKHSTYYINIVYNQISKHLAAASQNQFTLRSPTNDAIYAATESSTQRDKLIYGSKR